MYIKIAIISNSVNLLLEKLILVYSLVHFRTQMDNSRLNCANLQSVSRKSSGTQIKFIARARETRQDLLGEGGDRISSTADTFGNYM